MRSTNSIESLLQLRRSGELGAMQQEALSLVRLHPGRTAQELTEIARYRDPNKLRPRIVELARAGHIEPAGNRLCTITGRPCMTWRIKQTREQGELFG